MAWVRFDDKRALNAKLRAAGLEARGLDDAVICWCAHEETDGFISDADLAMLAALHGCKKPDAVAKKLTTISGFEVGRWIRDEKRGGYEVHDFLSFNPSHAELEAQRVKDRERKRKRAVAARTDSTLESGGNPDGIREEATRNP